MKKALFFAGLAAAALSFVGCNREADFAGHGRKVEIVLSDVATRTVNYGMSTEWKSGDGLSVFTAPTGTTNWSSNIKFTVQDASANRAAGEVELTADAYDWYAFYPYTSQIPNPTTLNPEGSSHERSGYVTVGGQAQVQKSDDNKEHLAGTKVPVFGNVKNVPADEMPVIEMKNATSVACFKVTNALEEGVRILSVKFTAPEDIVGTYYIDFSGTAPAFVASGDTYVYDNVTVTNSDPSSIAPDSNGEFYAVIKPFTAAAGAKLTVEVEAESADGAKKATATKEVTLTAATEFKPGFIKTLNIPFDVALEEAVPQELPYSEPFKGVGIGEFSIDNVNLPSALTYVWTYDSRYGMKASAFVNGTAYLTESWLVSPLIDLPSAAQPQLSFKHAVNQFASVAKAKEEATVWARVKGGEWTKLEVNYPADLGWTFVESGAIDLSDFAGNLVQIGFKYTSTADKAGTWEIQDFLVQDATVPEFGVEQTTFEVAANVTSVTVNVTGNVAWTVQDASEGVTAAPTSGSGAGTIAVSFPANTDPTEKYYSLKVVTDNAALVDAGEEEFVIDITQAAASTEAKAYPYEETFATSQGDFTINNVTLGEGLTYVWKHDSSNKYMKASAYAGSNKESESWLISPLVDLTSATEPRLYFSQCINKFFGNVAEEATVWIKEEGGEWAQLTISYPEITSGNWSKMTDYSVDIKSYVGKKVQVAFKYTSSTTAAGTWEIKNFKLDEAASGPVDPELTVSSSITVEEGKTATISVTTNSDGEKTWSTSDATVATVSNGVVTGVKPGSATITLSIAATANFNTKSATIPVTVTEAGLQDFTWDLTQASYDKASASSVKWINDAATMETTQASGATACNNYLGGDKTSTRFYSKNSLIFTPATGVTIIKVVYTATTEGYASTLANSTWTNATAVASGTEVVITPTDRTTAFSAVLGGTTGASSVKVYYTGTPVVVTLASITLSNPKTELIKGAEFDFGGTVTAHYSDGTTQDVTSEAQFSGYEMNTAGTYTVTVSYTEKGVTQTATYNLTVIVPTGGGTDILNQEFTGISGSNYTDFSGKIGTSGAVYAGQCAGSNSSIQLRSKNSNCGIVTTDTGGKAKKVTVTWESHTMEGRTLNIYGKNTAYSSASDLYDDAKQGTLLGSVTYGTSTEVTISGDYTYIGFRSAADAMYLSEIKIVWE